MPSKKAISKTRKQWNELPLFVRALAVIGATAGTVYGGYYLFFKGATPQKIKCPDTLTNAEKLYLQSLATDLHYEMDETIFFMEMGRTARSDLWTAVQILGEDYTNALCYLHNYWLEKLDPTTSLYTWINTEVTRGGSIEQVAQKGALKELKLHGLALI